MGATDRNIGRGMCRAPKFTQASTTASKQFITIFGFFASTPEVSKDETTVLKFAESLQLAMRAVGRSLDFADVVGREELNGVLARASVMLVRRAGGAERMEREEEQYAIARSSAASKAAALESER